MGILKELRSSLENPSTPLSYPAEWLLDIFNGGRTDSGIRVSQLTALQATSVYTCVDLISGGMASLDLNVYEQLQPRGKRLAFEQDMHWLLHDEPNPEMTAFTFKKTLQCHALLWGNLFAEIERNAAGQPTAIWPRMPHKTRPIRATKKTSWQLSSGELVTVQAGELVYASTEGADPNSQYERWIKAADMIHVPGLSLDGRLGKDVIDLARNAIGLMLASEKFGGKFFANGIRPTGTVKLPNDMEPQAVENFKRSLQESYGGENMLRPMVLETGMEWSENGIKPNEAQFLETRQHQRQEIAAFFHVPARMVGDSGKVNRSSAEQEAIEFVQYTLRPWIKAWQPELKRKLFPQRGRTANKFFPGFYYQDLLTPDSESRGKLIALLKQWGVGNTNDIREEFLDWNPVEGRAGQDYWMPVNMQDASNPMSAADGNGATTKPTKTDPADDSVARSHKAFFRNAVERLQAREKRDAATFRSLFTPVFTAISESFREISAGEFRLLEPPQLPEAAKFVNEYIDGMAKRGVEAGTEAQELMRAVRAIKIAVYREMATVKAKEN